MPTYDAPLPPTRSQGDPGPADDTNALVQAMLELRGALTAESLRITSQPIYAVRVWNPGTSTWPVRPAVPAGVPVTAYSTLYTGATPPTGALVGDIWMLHPDSIYWPS